MVLCVAFVAISFCPTLLSSRFTGWLLRATLHLLPYRLVPPSCPHGVPAASWFWLLCVALHLLPYYCALPYCPLITLASCCVLCHLCCPIMLCCSLVLLSLAWPLLLLPYHVALSLLPLVVPDGCCLSRCHHIILRFPLLLRCAGWLLLVALPLLPYRLAPPSSL